MEILTISFFSLVVLGLRDVQAAPTLSARVAGLEKDMRAGKLTDVTVEANMAALAERVDLVFAEIGSVKANAQNLTTQLNTVTQELRYVQQERDNYSNSLRKLRRRMTKQIRALQLKLDQTAADLRDARTTRCPETTAASTDPSLSKTVPPTPVTTQDSDAHASTTAAREDLTPSKTVPPTPVTTQDSNAHASTTAAREDLTPSKKIPPTPVTTQDSDAHAPPSPARGRDLYSASRDGDLEKVKRILDAGHVDINTRVGWARWTPLMVAAANGHSDVVEFLVGRGAGVSQVDRVGYNFLHFACWGGDLETVKLILSLNVVDVNARDNYGKTAADVARGWGHQRVEDLLVSRGAH